MDLKIFSTRSDQNAQVIKKIRLPGWRRIFFGVRTRILVLYVVLMAFSTVVSLLVIRELLLVRLQQQVEKFLIHEVEAFRRLTKGRNLSTDQPFGDNVAAIFNVFLSHNIPHDDSLMGM